jgi:hypothetical protein
MESKFIAARSKFYENNHWVIHVPFGHNAANEYMGLIERAENGGPRACANWIALSSGQQPPPRSGLAGGGGGGGFRVVTGRPHPLILTDRHQLRDTGAGACACV